MALADEPGERGEFEWKQHLHVGGAELAPREVRAAAQLRFDQIELVADHPLDARLERFPRLADARQVEPREEVQHERALREVHPVQVAHVLRRAARRHQAPVAMALD